MRWVTLECCGEVEDSKLDKWYRSGLLGRGLSEGCGVALWGVVVKGRWRFGKGSAGTLVASGKRPTSWPKTTRV